MTRVKLRIEVTYEVNDEVELRAAAVAADGDRNYRSADAAMHLWRKYAAERLILPGTTIVASAQSVIEPVD